LTEVIQGVRMSKLGPRNPRELLTPGALHILLSLAEGPRHGYRIQRDVEERTHGALRLGAGTLYEAIHRMKRSGWIESSGREVAERGGAPRKIYRLTREGRRRLREELSRMDALVRYARAREFLMDAEEA
jgi:DNA-binding PadR family transcriptional regulator